MNYWEQICAINDRQEEKGAAKYGMCLEDNTTLTAEQRINHLEEELVDALKYCEHLKQELATVKSGMSLNSLAKIIHNNAVAHGWWDEERTFGDVVALCHSELSEALEEYRSGRPLAYVLHEDDEKFYYETDTSKWTAQDKPEGIAVEMVDCIIRIFDWCAAMGVDVDALLVIKHEYNKTRPYKHGGKVI